MQTHFSSLGQYSIASAKIPEPEVIGSGGNSTPQIGIPLRLDVWHGSMRPGEGLELVSLSAKLWALDGYISICPPVPLNTTLQSQFPRIQDQLCYLNFPLDAIRLTHLERERNGGDMKFRLEAALLINQLFAVGKTPGEISSQTIWGHVQAHQLHLQAELKIPRDTWVSRVLPNVGYGVIHILEFPAAPLESCAKLQHSMQALQQAQELHKIGLYDDAVGKCRVALDPFFEFIETTGEDKVVRRVPTLKRSWETQLGKATYSWLDGTLGAIKEAANRAHHSPRAHYSQLDSQMIFAIASAVVAYVARTVEIEPSK